MSSKAWSLGGFIHRLAHAIGSSLVGHIASGAGAVATTVQAKLRESVSVLDYIPVAEHAAIRAGTSTYDCAANIQAAIDSVSTFGGKLIFPPGRYRIGTKLIVGNGTASAISTVHSVSLIGAGTGFTGQEFGTPTPKSATELVWTGASGGTMLEIAGPIASVTIKGFMFDCAGLANTALLTVHIVGSTIEDIVIRRWMTDAWRWTAYKSMPNLYIGSCENVTRNVRIADASTSANVSCLNIGLSASVPGDLDVCRNEFHSCTFLAPDNSSCSSLVLQFTDLLSFYQCFFYSAGAGSAATVRVLPPTGNLAFPSGCVWYNCSIHKAPVIANTWAPPDTYSSGQNSGLHFYPFSSDGLGQEPSYSGGGIHGFTHNGTAIYKRQLTCQYGSAMSETAVVVHRAMSDTTVANTITQTNVFIYVIPGGMFKTDREIKIRLRGSYLNNSGGSANVQLRGFLGSSLAFDSSLIALATGSTPRAVILDISISARNASAAQQMLSAMLDIGAVGSASGAMAPASTRVVGVHNALTENSASSLTFAVTVAHGTASPNISITINEAIVELL